MSRGHRSNTKRPKDVLNHCYVLAQDDELRIYRIAQFANYDVALLAGAYNQLVGEWNSEIKGDHNRYGHHTNQFTMNRYKGIRMAIGKAMADAEDRAYRRGRKRDRPISWGGRPRGAKAPGRC
jgi:hypothetical protein